MSESPYGLSDSSCVGPSCLHQLVRSSNSRWVVPPRSRPRVRSGTRSTSGRSHRGLRGPIFRSMRQDRPGNACVLGSKRCRGDVDVPALLQSPRDHLSKQATPARRHDQAILPPRAAVSRRMIVRQKMDPSRFCRHHRGRTLPPRVCAEDGCRTDSIERIGTRRALRSSMGRLLRFGPGCVSHRATAHVRSSR